MKYQFPSNFFWGASTSAHQVEGGLNNDWTLWEKNNADDLAKQANSYWQSWQQDKFPEMFDESNYISGQSCDHYNRYEHDFDLVKELGHNAHRFSIEWSRVEPEEGKFDEDQLAHYSRVVDALNNRGIEPLVTFYHWPLPLWLSEKGGWECDEIVDYFERYCVKLGEVLAGKIRYIFTINEPLVFSGHGYVTGEWPPGKKNYLAYYLIVNKLIDAHRRVYAKLKMIDDDFLIGIAAQNNWFEAEGNSLVNRTIKKLADWWINERFLDAIDDYQDFIGLNHYFHNKIDWGLGKNTDAKVSDLGWELMPESLYHCLLELKRFDKPIIISEHGLADCDDKYRQWFLRESLIGAHRAIEEGVDLRGYLHWSFMDNFEWSRGFWPRFGLVEIDYRTMERKPRQSALYYKKVIRDNGIIY